MLETIGLSLFLAFVFSPKGFIWSLLLILLGVMIRDYVGRIWPNETKAARAFLKANGGNVEDAAKKAADRIRTLARENL